MFKDDLEKLIQNAKPGDSISVAIVGTETDKQEYEKAGVNLVVVGKQFNIKDDIPELYHEIASRHKCSALELYAVVPVKYDADADVIESWAKMFDIGMIT